MFLGGSHSDPHSLPTSYLPTSQAIIWKHFYRALNNVPCHLDLNISEFQCCLRIQNNSSWGCFNRIVGLKLESFNTSVPCSCFVREDWGKHPKWAEHFTVYLSQLLNASNSILLPSFLFILQHHSELPGKGV